MNVDFRTSDLHFGHVNIIEYCNRPFDDVDHMNEMLVQYWNETVLPSDSVLILGDLCMGRITDSLEYVKRLNGNKFLVPGNHDPVHSMYVHKPRFAEFWQMYHDAGLTVVGENLLSKIDGQDVWECHFPYAHDHTEEQRFSDYRPQDNGLWLLHGHIHDEWKVRDRMLNVGTDVWDFRPVHTDQIKEIIS